MKFSLKKIFNFVTLSILLISISACSTIKNTENILNIKPPKEVTLYFTKSKKSDEVHFVITKRKISSNDNIIDITLRELLLGPTKEEEENGIMTEIPTGTRLIKIDENEDKLLVDLSNQFIAGGGSATIQLRYLQFYKTLKKIAPDKKIYLNVGGKTLKTIGGEGLEVTQPITKIYDYTEKFEKNDEIQP